MKNHLPEFSNKIFDKPEQLDLYSELIDSHIINGFKNYISKKEFDKKFLSKIDTPELAYDYCYKYKVKNNPEMEKIVATSPKYSFYYAGGVLRGRFKLGEPAIAKEPRFSYEYANDILKGRFELGEKAIATDPQYSFHYAQGVLKGRFKLGEPAIAKEPNYSFFYANFVLKGRFELGEKVIMTSPYFRDKYIEFLKSKNIPIPKAFQV